MIDVIADEFNELLVEAVAIRDHAELQPVAVR
jgi:hypothetical protein